MPKVGTPNNASGANGWSGFGDEEPYGQATKDAALAHGAPLAGARVASGPIAAPKRATRQSQRPAAPQPATAAPVPAGPPSQPEPSYDAKLAQWWQNIASVPGASDLVKTYAAAAAQRLTSG